MFQTILFFPPADHCLSFSFSTCLSSSPPLLSHERVVSFRCGYQKFLLPYFPRRLIVPSSPGTEKLPKLEQPPPFILQTFSQMAGSLVLAPGRFFGWVLSWPIDLLEGRSFPSGKGTLIYLGLSCSPPFPSSSLRPGPLHLPPPCPKILAAL